MEEKENLDLYLEAIQQVDNVLKGPVKSLIKIAFNSANGGKEKHPKCNPNKLDFPPWVADDLRTGPDEGTKNTTKAVCCSTLQRVWRERRRFDWLGKEELRWLECVKPCLVNAVFPSKESPTLRDYEKYLKSGTFGNLNPFTAAHVFRVLSHEGESKAHSAMGFLGFFCMAWSLLRRYPEGRIRGARLEPWEPTAHVTAKCLLPIGGLWRICERRAKLFEDIIKALDEIRKVTQQAPRERTAGLAWRRWEFARQLEMLSAHLFELKPISINPKVFGECADIVSECAGTLTSTKRASSTRIELADVRDKVITAIAKALKDSGEDCKKISKDAVPVIRKIKRTIHNELTPRQGPKYLEEYGIEMRDEIKHGRDGKEKRRYWKDYREAGEEALKMCQLALDNLKGAHKICVSVDVERFSTISKALRFLARTNWELSKRIHDSLAPCAKWCRSVVEREIAHASAGNETDFDPAELVSGIAAAVRWREMTSSLEVADAIGKALKGAREDGSWGPGQAFFSSGRALEVYAVTSDIVWTLASALMEFPDIKIADEALHCYVNWLERSQREVRWKGSPKLQTIKGWTLERSHARNRVDLWPTALSVNALLEIRNLWEYRLWQLCERRFTLVPAGKSIWEIDPVDLGALHENRLHRRLSKMARETDGDGYKDAEYSLVLHGPPGSSKTAIAQALAKEMWHSLDVRPRGKLRLIKVTPADFTRLGEDRLDSEAQFIFSLLQGLRGVTVIFDEIDDLLRKRNPKEEMSFMKLVVPAMLNRLADLRAACPRQQVCFLIATNYIENIEQALIRPGRIDAAIPVVYPDVESRRAVVGRHKADLLKNGVKKDEKVAALLEKYGNKIVEKTVDLSWMKIEELCKKFTSKARSERWKDSKTTREKIENLLNDYAEAASDPDYLSRWLDHSLSAELCNEFLDYTMAGFDVVPKYKTDRKKWKSEWVKRITKGRKADPKMPGQVLESLFSKCVRRWGCRGETKVSGLSPSAVPSAGQGALGMERKDPLI